LGTGRGIGLQKEIFPVLTVRLTDFRFFGQTLAPSRHLHQFQMVGRIQVGCGKLLSQCLREELKGLCAGTSLRPYRSDGSQAPSEWRHTPASSCILTQSMPVRNPAPPSLRLPENF